MAKIFEFTKHNILWLHMSEYYTIEKLAYKMKYEDKFSTLSIRIEKMHYIMCVFNDCPANECYACDATPSITSCYDCPIGICGDEQMRNLYSLYYHTISRYAYTNKKIYREEAHKIALQIANASKNEYTSIEYIWR